MIFTGAMKNIFGFVPAFNKAKQHVKYPDRYKFGKFFVDLEEVIKPHFHIMDGIMALEGPGPGNGYPKKVNVLLASVNPLALDIIASRIVGYSPLEIPTNKIALERGLLLKNINDIIIKGTDPETIVVKDFKRIVTGSEAGIILKYFKNKIPFLKRFDKRPFFNSRLCISCSKCIDICPVKTLRFDDKNKNKVLINDAKCIRCYCCHEVCRDRAIDIKRKVF
jgi:ferredoxin